MKNELISHRLFKSYHRHKRVINSHDDSHDLAWIGEFIKQDISELLQCVCVVDLAVREELEELLHKYMGLQYEYQQKLANVPVKPITP